MFKPVQKAFWGSYFQTSLFKNTTQPQKKLIFSCFFGFFGLIVCLVFVHSDWFLHRFFGCFSVLGSPSRGSKPRHGWFPWWHPQRPQHRHRWAHRRRNIDTPSRPLENEPVFLGFFFPYVFSFFVFFVCVWFVFRLFFVCVSFVFRLCFVCVSFVSRLFFLFFFVCVSFVFHLFHVFMLFVFFLDVVLFCFVFAFELFWAVLFLLVTLETRTVW